MPDITFISLSAEELKAGQLIEPYVWVLVGCVGNPDAKALLSLDQLNKATEFMNRKAGAAMLCPSPK